MIRCIMEISSWSNIRKTIRRHIYLKCNVSRNYGRMKGRTEYFILLICSQKCFFFFEKMLWFFISWLYQGWKYRSCSSNILFTSICIQWTDFLTFIKHMVDHCRQKQNDEHNNKCGVWTEDNLVCKKVHLLYFHHWFEHTRNIPGNIIWWPLILPVYEKKILLIRYNLNWAD